MILLASVLLILSFYLLLHSVDKINKMVSHDQLQIYDEMYNVISVNLVRVSQLLVALMIIIYSITICFAVQMDNWKCDHYTQHQLQDSCCDQETGEFLQDICSSQIKTFAYYINKQSSIQWYLWEVLQSM